MIFFRKNDKVFHQKNHGHVCPKDKLLYIMHVDWGWIKQRPHFIAEGLSRYYQLLVMYRFNPNRRHMISNNSDLKKLPLITIPRRFGVFFEKLDGFIQRIWILIILGIFKPNKIWLTFPTQFEYLPKRAIEKLEIFYDCMDDCLEFYDNQDQKQRIRRLEGLLINKAKTVFCSSKHLCDVLTERHQVESKLTLVRNGVKDTFLIESNGDSFLESTLWKKEASVIDIVYIGTVAEWINFDLIDQCLDQFLNLRFHFIGPVDAHPKLKNQEKIRFYGAIEHSKLFENADSYDVLMMPFIRNQLIESVDPVKLYEYVAYKKPIISIYYPEIERFSPYVNFYKNNEEFFQIMKEVSTEILKRKYTDEEGNAFLQSNTWENRVSTVRRKLEE